MDSFVNLLKKKFQPYRLKLFSNIAKRSPIPVGEKSFRVVTVSDKTIMRLSEDVVNNDLFGSAALDEVKQKLKTGIDPNK